MNDEKSSEEKSLEEKSGLLKSRFWPGNWRKKERDLLFKLGAVLVVGLIFMNVVSGNDAKSVPSVNVSEDVVTSEGYRNSENELERRLENVLSKIKGAGSVSVAVTFVYGAESQYAVDSEFVDRTSTEGVDAVAKSVETQEKKTVAEQDGVPVIVKEYMPKVQGVLVVAEGGGNSVVREEIFEAVGSLLGVSAHRVNVVEGN